MSKPNIVRVTVTGSEASTAGGAWAALAEARAALQEPGRRMAEALAAAVSRAARPAAYLPASPPRA